MTTISDNYRDITARIAAAAQRSGRQASDIKLVAATKQVPPELIIEAVNAGLTDIGENRVQEAASKFDALKGYDIKWHMIGHLQTNKVKPALDIFSVIQSVDSERLADEISKRAQRPVEVFIEVNTSGEESKHGVAPEGALALAKHAASLPNIELAGLMTVGPLTEDAALARKSFRTLKELFNAIKVLNLPSVKLKYLSMGMSGDFELAIEEGSNLVRIGRALFGIEHKYA